MQKLKWSDWLAEMAENWVRCCVQLNNKTQYDPGKNSSIGQNVLTITTNRTPDEELLILNWYKQSNNMEETDIRNFTSVSNSRGTIGHYSQMMWANTREVGCAMASYAQLMPEGIKTGNKLFRFVCNYNPIGNVVGQPIYLIDTLPCSMCPIGCDVVMKSLCKTDMFPVSDFRDRPIAKELKFTPVFEESEPLPIIDQVYTWFNSYVRVTAVVDEGANCTCLLRLPKKYQLDEE
ncbi:venom allergen 5 [Aethina tumida]|uniref:venom allergen 5 n=1 Tax=Aethina tumida TaxID=116153 RepID=UPI002148F321|nr:venom allergen 5 [Aethina tumida]